MSWSAADIPDQRGRIAVVTGANGGLGLETARRLAGQGAHVVMAVRNQQKAAAAIDDIRAGVPAASLELVALDLSAQESVRTAAEQITAALKGSSAVDASPACVASLRPSGPLPAPGHMPAGSTMAAIYRRGYLIVGVDQTTPLLSYRDPVTGRVDGFNVAIARQVAKAIFGDENAIKPVAITSAQRKSAIESHPAATW